MYTHRYYAIMLMMSMAMTSMASEQNNDQQWLNNLFAEHEVKAGELSVDGLVPITGRHDNILGEHNLETHWDRYFQKINEGEWIEYKEPADDHQLLIIKQKSAGNNELTTDNQIPSMQSDVPPYKKRKKNNFSCRLCNKITHTEHGMSKHMKSHLLAATPILSPYRCSACPTQGALMRYYLRNHIFKHAQCAQKATILYNKDAHETLQLATKLLMENFTVVITQPNKS